MRAGRPCGFQGAVCGAVAIARLSFPAAATAAVRFAVGSALGERPDEVGLAAVFGAWFFGQAAVAAPRKKRRGRTGERRRAVRAEDSREHPAAGAGAGWNMAGAGVEVVAPDP